MRYDAMREAVGVARSRRAIRIPSIHGAHANLALRRSLVRLSFAAALPCVLTTTYLLYCSVVAYRR